MDEIRWPVKFEPQNTKVFVSNELIMPAPADRVWAWLLAVKTWPEWYVNSANVLVRTPGAEILAPDVRFRWKTFDVTLESQVIEFVPERRLAWSATHFGIDAYHAWLLEPLPDGSTRVLTQETQNGWLARLSALFLPNRMHKYHQIWLEGLKAQAERGFPPQQT